MRRPPPREPEPIELTDARDFDPLTGDGEHPELATAAVDGDAATNWMTDDYQPGKLPQDGVGLYVDGGRLVKPGAVEITTSTPGFEAEVYAASKTPPSKFPDSGWKRVANAKPIKNGSRLVFAGDPPPGQFYLVWIKSLPPRSPRVELGEVRLLDCGRAATAARAACVAPKPKPKPAPKQDPRGT